MPLDPNGKPVPVHVVDLSSSDAEYVDVRQKFDQTMAKHYRSIVRIQRIQNPALYFQFIVRKKEMDKYNPPGHQNEHKLYHGTSADTCPKINQSGFNRSFAGKNGNVRMQSAWQPWQPKWGGYIYDTGICFLPREARKAQA